MSKKISGIILSLLLVFLTACSGNTSSDATESDLDAIRNYASSYSELVNGRDAIYTLSGMLSYYDDASYKTASSTAKISKSVRAEYFPSVNWSGSAFLAQEQTGSIQNVSVCALSNSAITFMFLLRIESLTALPQVHAYQAVYSLNSDEITEVTKIY